MNFKNHALWTLILSGAILLACGGQTPQPETPDGSGSTTAFIISGVDIPASISVEHGQDYTFNVKGKGPAAGDQIIFTEVGGSSKASAASAKASAASATSGTVMTEVESNSSASATPKASAASAKASAASVTSGTVMTEVESNSSASATPKASAASAKASAASATSGTVMTEVESNSSASATPKASAASAKASAASAAPATPNTVTTTVKSADSRSFTITIPDGLEEGEYSMKVRRGDKSVTLTSSVKVQIIVTLPQTPSADANLYGLVLSGTKPLAGVCVSDGFDVVQTDSRGYYELKSDKAHKYVFVTLPSGYAAESDGIIPKIWQKTAKPASEAERIDFRLHSDGDQTRHTLLVMGDLHLAKRTNDRGQYAKFTDEVNSYLSEHKGEKVYGLTLGDMTWDLYWYQNGYAFRDYLADANAIKGMQIFHTIGNHDHDMNAVGDWDTVIEYKDIIAPDYYSFNIGGVHYIVLDNIQCTNAVPSKKDGSNRTYVETVVPDDLNWLVKDLKHVSKDTPVVVAMHASLYTQTGSISLKNGADLISYFNGYEDVTFVTGHTHKMWTIDNGRIHEHNTGAVCAAWWWAGYYHPTLNIAQDGAPGGYRVMDVNGKSISSYYKGTGRDAAQQFRVYDRNCINIDAAALAPAKAAEFDSDLTKYGAYNTVSTSNQVLINVWDYNKDWKISVTEGGKELKVSQITAYDPLYLITYCAGRYAAGAASLSFAPFKTNHMFSVTASGPDTDLVVKVTDDEGREYVQNVARPLAFSVDTYK